MKLRTVFALSASLLACSLCFAADAPAQVPQAAASKAAKSAPASKGDKAVKPKAAPKPALVDINSASKEELKKLPGIGDAQADKIIAGRPYGSKGWLVSHKVLAEDEYPAIKALIVAKQPFNDAAKNAAQYGKKK